MLSFALSCRKSRLQASECQKANKTNRHHNKTKPENLLCFITVLTHWTLERMPWFEIDIDAASMSMNVNLVISSPCSEGIAFTILLY